MSNDFDLIIIGGGGAGLAAGIMAKKQGASVMVLEADTKLGGATALSAAVMYACNTSVQKARGIEDTPSNRAWQLLGGMVLTGEDASYKGVVRPNHPFTLNGRGWGAFELVARYGRLTIDDDAFPLYADPAKAVSAEHGWGLGLNWYLTSNFKLVANYTQTSFDAALGATEREDEKVFFTRAQFSF